LKLTEAHTIGDMITMLWNLN